MLNQKTLTKQIFSVDENTILASLPRPLATIDSIDDRHLMDEANAFVQRFELAVDIYMNNSNDKSAQPHMWPSDYVSEILQHLMQRTSLSQLPKRDTAYQVLFIVGILMRLPSSNTHASWWKKTFADNIFLKYFEKTFHFKNQNTIANTVVTKIRNRTEPVLDLFATYEDTLPKTMITLPPDTPVQIKDSCVFMGPINNPTFVTKL